MNNIIKESFLNIKRDYILFLSTLVNLTIVFLILNFFALGILNLKKFNSKISSNLQIKLYIENDLTSDAVSNIESFLLKMEEVESVKFVPKKLSIIELAKDLNMDMNFEENPIPDMFLININSNINLENFLKVLEKEDGVKEIVVRKNLIEKMMIFSENLNKLSIIITLVMSIAIFIMIFNLIYYSIMYRKKDIEIMSFVGASRMRIKGPFILEAFIGIFMASVLGQGLFILLYKTLKKAIIHINPFFITVSLKESFYFSYIFSFVIGTIIAILAVVLSSRIYLRVYGK